MVTVSAAERCIDTSAPTSCWIRRIGKSHCCTISTIIMIAEVVFGGIGIALAAEFDQRLAGSVIGGAICTWIFTALILCILYRHFLTRPLAYENSEVVAED